jgi:hypothetical protein
LFVYYASRFGYIGCLIRSGVRRFAALPLCGDPYEKREACASQFSFAIASLIFS